MNLELELRAVLNKLDDLLEAARGPGKHSVYMSLKDARYHCGDALYAEESRIAQSLKSEPEEQRQDAEENEHRPDCETCGDRGWIPAANGHDEYIGNGEIRCPHCMKGLTA